MPIEGYRNRKGVLNSCCFVSSRCSFSKGCAMSELETISIFAGCMYVLVVVLVVLNFRGVKNEVQQFTSFHIDVDSH